MLPKIVPNTTRVKCTKGTQNRTMEQTPNTKPAIDSPDEGLISLLMLYKLINNKSIIAYFFNFVNFFISLLIETSKSYPQ